MRCRFLTYDVFTDHRFGGNPLGIVPDARGMTVSQMQLVARELNLSETTFVLPSEQGLGPRVRIFTPKSELPFAGHPTIGTAICLRDLGEFEGDEVTLEEGAGPVRVTIGGDGKAEFRAPLAPEIGEQFDVTLAAEALGLAASQFASPPCSAGAGLLFPMVEVSDLGALAAARLRPEAPGHPLAEEVFLFTRQTDDPSVDVRARMFAPAHGIAEDPATGSACAGLAGLLAHRDDTGRAELAWRVMQGVEMGRPSTIDIRAHKQGGRVDAVWVKGAAVPVADGEMRLD